MKRKIIILTLALSGTVTTVQAEDRADECLILLEEKNYHQAFPICQQAAELGEANAQFNLGWMYFNGEGLIQDDQEAYIWFSLAAINGDEKYKKARDSVAKRLTANELRVARQETKKRLQAIKTAQ